MSTARERLEAVCRRFDIECLAHPVRRGALVQVTLTCLRDEHQETWSMARAASHEVALADASLRLVHQLAEAVPAQGEVRNALFEALVGHEPAPIPTGTILQGDPTVGGGGVS